MKCHVCGCTDEQACPGGCAWALPRMCTKCAGKSGLAGLGHDVVGLRLTGLEALQVFQALVVALKNPEFERTEFLEQFVLSLADRLAQTAPVVRELFESSAESGLILPGR